jgi:hypothetical protein
MYHRSEIVIDARGNTVERHYQLDLAGNWVYVGATSNAFLRGALEFKSGIDKNRKRKRGE